MTTALLSVALFLARAGGGHGSTGVGGGGGGGSHISSGGGGGASGLFWLPFLFGGGGGFIILLIIGFVLFKVIGGMAGRGRGGGQQQGLDYAPPPGEGADAGRANVPTGAAAGAEAGWGARGGVSAQQGGVAPGQALSGAPPGTPGAAYDDSRPVGVPERFRRGSTLPGSDDAAVQAGQGSWQAGLDAIRAHDAAFDVDNFLSQVNRTFFIVQQAWTELKPEMSRQVMADGLWQQHHTQIQDYQNRHQRNVLENLMVRKVSMLGAHSDQSYDTITLRVDAACADYDVDTDKNRVVRGNRDIENWSEDWVFQRSSKASTKASGGTLSQKCPNCGAPLDVDLAGVCSYCKAPVMSGAYDWVLSRIDQVI